ATTFSPDVTCTRGQVVTFLWRTAGQPEAKSSACNFTDVKADSYYHKAVIWAVENGITGGTGETTFSPDTNCTRAQVVTFLYRFINR
ncbi:MAG: S-layer homology domain-containing protein, partial [Clostridia bacterium]|nr:S-layer homology domain-containing protein [Clostridia bacterium]